jgi:plasmid stabilization system protein ParE
MGFKVIWSEAAAAELEDICSYIAQDDPEAATRVARSIVGHIDLLVSFPFIGPVYQRGLNTTLRLISFRSYRILMSWTSAEKLSRSFTSGMVPETRRHLNQRTRML